MNCRLESKLKVEDNLQIGIYVGIGRCETINTGNEVKHHGIITSVDYKNRNFQIVELTVSDTDVNFLKIMKTSIRFEDSDILYRYTYKHDDKEPCTNDFTKERAEILFDTFNKLRKFNVNLGKCTSEQFACYCVTGVAFGGTHSDVNETAGEELDKM